MLSKREKAILTYTNTSFYPLDPQEDEVKIDDIAHALSQMCRANGHFKDFYSVAQHCINCAQEAKARGLSVRIQLACLLHDASEAYISDITRPVKCYLETYREIEAHLQNVIYKKFKLDDLTSEEYEQIGEIDNTLLHHEFKRLHYKGIYEETPQIYMEHDFTERKMKEVEQEFIQLSHRLIKNLAVPNRVGGHDEKNKE